ncbi:MAG TPA: hypothetical protein DE042_09620 [Colwellia sp.]|nr:hypothetical protein [Colwellia sp.]
MLYKAQHNSKKGRHYGSRIVFDDQVISQEEVFEDIGRARSLLQIFNQYTEKNNHTDPVIMQKCLKTSISLSATNQ